MTILVAAPSSAVVWLPSAAVVWLKNAASEPLLASRHDSCACFDSPVLNPTITRCGLPCYINYIILYGLVSGCNKYMLIRVMLVLKIKLLCHIFMYNIFSCHCKFTGLHVLLVIEHG